MIAFISIITETSTNQQILSELVLDLAFYTIIAGVVGWLLFGKQKKKVMTKAFFSLMILAPLLFLIFHFNG
jgi:hypothetical protein